MKNFCNKAILLILFSVLICLNTLKCQVEIDKSSFIKYGMHDDINPGGDLSFTLPLLTIPGRDGLDYPINISYKYLGQFDREATWVGLDWNIQIGSVTRSVVNQVDEQIISQFGSTSTFNPGGNVGFIDGMLETNGRFTNRNGSDEFDQYSLNLPEGTMSLVPVEKVQTGLESGGIKFYTDTWKGLNVDYAGAQNQWNSLSGIYQFIQYWRIRTPEGTIMNFGRNTSNPSNMIEIRNGNTSTGTNGGDIRLGTPANFKYPISWDISDIRSANYVDVHNDGLTDDDKGSWVKFNYNVTNTTLQFGKNTLGSAALGPYDSFTFAVNENNIWHRGRFGAATSGSTSDYLGDIYVDYSIPTQIETPTHIAQFFVSDRADIVGLNSNCAKRLDSLVLYRKQGSLQPIRIKKIAFRYSNLSIKSKVQKLDAIEQYGPSDSDKLPPTEFKYIDASNSYDSLALKEVKYPEGGSIEYELEHDKFSLFTNGFQDGTAAYGDKFASFSCNYINNSVDAYTAMSGYGSSNKPIVIDGTCRLKTVTMKNAMGLQSVIKYTYGDGVTVAPVVSNAAITTSEHGIWNASGVIYRWIQAQYSDSTKRKVYFTSGIAPTIKGSDGNFIYYNYVHDEFGSPIPPNFLPPNRKECYADQSALIETSTPQFVKCISNASLRGAIWKEEKLDSAGVMVYANEEVSNYDELNFENLDFAFNDTSGLKGLYAQDNTIWAVSDDIWNMERVNQYSTNYALATDSWAKIFSKNTGGSTKFIRNVQKVSWMPYSKKQEKTDGVIKTISPVLAGSTGQMQSTITSFNINGNPQYYENDSYFAHEYSKYRLALEDKNMWAQPLVEFEGPGNGFMNHAKKFSWKDFGGGNWRIDSIYEWRAPIGTSRQTFAICDPNFVLRKRIEKYDDYGNELVSSDAQGVKTTKIFGYNKKVPIAVINHKDALSCFFGGFDDYADYTTQLTGWSDQSNWQVLNGEYQLIQPIAPTGSNWSQVNLYTDTANYKITAGVLEADVKLASEKMGLLKYIDANNYVRFELRQDENKVRIEAMNAGTLSYVEDTSTISINKWYHLKSEIGSTSTGLYIDGKKLLTINSSAVPGGSGNIALQFGLYSSNAGRSLSVDNIRSYSPGSLVKSYSYDPRFLLPNCYVDENGFAHRYQYDNFGRLVKEYSSKGLLLKEVSYTFSRTQANNWTYSQSSPNMRIVKQYRSGQPGDFEQLTEFFDGFGNLIQSQKSNGINNIISHVEYDEMMRNWKVYKPYTAVTNNVYDLNFVQNCKAEYLSQGIDLGLYPYTANLFYKDGLGRLQGVKAPGSVFQNNYLHYTYGANASGEISEYLANELSRKTLYDENQNQTVEYTDAIGRVISKRQVIDGGSLETKFEYDRGDLLSRVTAPNGDITYYYYNTDKTVRQKTSPDAGTVQNYYDKNGNLRIIKDGNHQGTINSVNFNNTITLNTSRTENFTLNNKGKVSIRLNASHNAINYGSVTLKISGPNNITLYTLSATSSNPYPSGTVVLPKLPSGQTYNYYISSSVDNSIVYIVQCQTSYDFIYNKYDSFNRLTETGEYETSSPNDFSQSNADNPEFPTSGTLPIKKYIYDTPSTDVSAAGQRNLQGRLSYSVFNSPGTANNTYENNVTYYSYDELGRVEWTVQLDLGWYQKKLTYSYDLKGNITQKGYIDYDWRSGSFYSSYVYDQAGRLMNLSTSPNSNMSGSNREASYEYFASGKPKRLALGSLPSDVSKAVQGMDYRYNERDWLTMINHQNLTSAQDPGGDGANGVPADKFGMILGYNRLTDIGTAQNTAAQWNGNISWLMYNISGGNYTGPSGTSSLVGYTYSYDKTNRLLSADFGYYYGSQWYKTYDYDENNITYDNNGNIKTLTRYSNNAGLSDKKMDKLAYIYNSGNNQLNAVSDSVSDNSYTMDIDNQSANNYIYDGNGNILSDAKNSIGFILYNSDNLPERFYKTDGSNVFNAYCAIGQRVRKLSSGGSDTYYVNSPDGKNEVVDLAPYGFTYTYNIWGLDNLGQVRANNGSYSRFYYLKDHLGNIRVTVNGSGSVDSYNDYYPFGMISRSLTGSADKRYKFTGKEKDEETGLDYFGARYYDSRIGRWLSVDPLDSKYPGLSPYNYCKNNPTLIIDPNGKWGINANLKNGKVPVGFPAESPGGSYHMQYLRNGKDFDANHGYIDKINGFAQEGGEWMVKGGWHYAPNVAKYLREHNIRFAFSSNFQSDGWANGAKDGIILQKDAYDKESAQLTLHEIVHKMRPGEGEFPAYAAEYAAGYYTDKDFLLLDYGINSLLPYEFSQYFKKGILDDAQKKEFLKEVKIYGKKIIGN